jgi:hypothetical protein
MADDPPDLFTSGAVVKHFHAEHSPLEAFLACLIDGQPALDSPPSREIRIRDALKSLTDKIPEWVDDPSGKHARALYRMAEYQYEEYLAQLLPEHGGPPVESNIPVDESSVSKLARRVRIELDLPESDEEILRKKYAGKYGKDPRALGDPYAFLPIDRFNSFDSVADSEMLGDFKALAVILGKYGVKLEFKNVFWRTLGKLRKPIPNTD